MVYTIVFIIKGFLNFIETDSQALSGFINNLTIRKQQKQSK